MADDDVVYPVISDEDLIAAGLSPEHNNDVRDAVATLFGVDVSSGPAPIDLDGGGDSDSDSDRDGGGLQHQQHRR